MKFRAKLQGPYLSNLKDLFSAVDKISDMSVVILSPERTRIVNMGTGDGPSCFSEIENPVLFYEFKIESLTSNEIYLKVSNKNILKGLSDVQNAISGVLKLSKKNNLPILEISLETRDVLSIVHDVPVELIEASEVQSFNEPEISPPEIKIEFPHYDVMRRVTSNLKLLHKTLQIGATHAGELSLKSETDSIQVRTVFNDLRVLDVSEGHTPHDFRVRVLAHQFLKLTNYCLLKPLDSVCCLSPDAVALYCVVIRSGLVVTYYLPIIDFERPS